MSAAARIVTVLLLTILMQKEIAVLTQGSVKGG